MNSMKAQTIVLVSALLATTGLLPQSGDGLDFLDKVENIQIPKDKAGSDTSGKTGVKVDTKSSQTKSPTTTTATTSSKTPTKSVTGTGTQGSSTKSSGTQAPATKKTAIPSTTVPSTVTSTPTPPATQTTRKTAPLSPTVTTGTQDSPPSPPIDPNSDKVDGVDTAGFWLDQPLAMEPDFLPGFESLLSTELQPDQNPPSSPSSEGKKPHVYPDPVVTGDYSLWASFTGFLAKYQKAFYIFGILLLFALYRLKMGRSSSSARRSSPTIRRMRR